ncbi:MAG TPA: patatin-like phospholipase family protein [Syntrophales bacterium]|nr:patatin-like phospholipase family protein [Syntrophales bacterium]
MTDSSCGFAKRFGSRGLWVALSVIFLSACTAQYPLNPKVDNINREVAYRMKLSDRDRSQELLLILAFSGGGIRAASLSYGILEALDLVEVPLPELKTGERHTMLDEVDMISSVSGGSFTAAYYGLHGRDIFNDFRRDFLYENYQAGLLWGLANPVNWVLLSSPRYGRSDMAQEYYDNRLFKGATLGDIAKRRGPAINILSTDAIDGISFSFTPSQFAMICSDFDKFPVARAVAASAAFPGAFSPVVLKNYSGTCDARIPRWMEIALAKPDISNRTYYNARRMKTYLDPTRKPYIHLIDGGVSDNLGVRGTLETLIARGGIREALKEANLEKTRRVAIIIVDAETQDTASWQVLDEVPGLTSVVGSSSTIMINRYNFETIELLNHVISDWTYEDEHHGRKPIDFYKVHVAFDALPDQGERDYFNRIPTSLYLPEDQVDRLRDAAVKILYSDKNFLRLVTDLGGRMPEVKAGKADDAKAQAHTAEEDIDNEFHAMP